MSITWEVIGRDTALAYSDGMIQASRTVGELIREWRQHRRISQLDLALDAEISPKHLSFVETGRSQPSREMILRLAETLQVPLRARNALLHAAGYAAAFAERPLDDPALSAVRAAVDVVLKGHEPSPALAVDRHWTLVASNRVVPMLLQGISASLLQPPVNVLRLSLHPEGLAPRIANLAEWRRHLLERLRRQIDATADSVLEELFAELRTFPAPKEERAPANRDYAGVVVPFELRTPNGVLAFFSTTTVFGTPVDITVSELALESFFPANDFTATALRGLAEKAGVAAGGP